MISDIFSTVWISPTTAHPLSSSHTTAHPLPCPHTTVHSTSSYPHTTTHPSISHSTLYGTSKDFPLHILRRIETPIPHTTAHPNNSFSTFWGFVVLLPASGRIQFVTAVGRAGRECCLIVSGGVFVSPVFVLSSMMRIIYCARCKPPHTKDLSDLENI